MKIQGIITTVYRNTLMNVAKSLQGSGGHGHCGLKSSQ